MAEFCIDCWNEINELEDREEDCLMTKTEWLCEECGEYKNVVIARKEDAGWRIYLAYYMHVIKFEIYATIGYIIDRFRYYSYLKRRQKRRKFLKEKEKNQ